MNKLMPVFVWLAILGTAPAHAEMKTGDLLDAYASANQETKTMLEAIVTSTENGLAWANTDLKVQRKELPIYCTPDQLPLNPTQILEILKHQSSERPFLRESYLGYGIMFSMRATFPCQ